MMRTIAETARMIAVREVSPVELAREALERIAALNAKLHAFLLVTEERAMADARAAEARQMRDALVGPLDGIPVAHKDIYETAGIRTTAHSAQLRDHVPERDAFAVRRWAEAGTVMLGKLATHEFAFGGPSPDLPWPVAINPWTDGGHFTGGSSSGTGAAIASGMILGGTGSDTGGSIRNPAAFCGLAGIKPSYGLCSRAGVLPLAQTLDHAGPLAWTSEDCAILLEAMAGHDPQDPASADRPVPRFDVAQGVQGRRVGLVRHFHERDGNVSEATRRGIEETAAILRGLGATVEDITLPPLADYHAPGWVILLAEARAVHERLLRKNPMGYGEVFRCRMALAGLLAASDYVQAQRRRRALIRRTLAATEAVDLLLTATVAAEAPLISAADKWASISAPGYTMPFNVLGWPALSLCTGFGEGGLPVAAQIVGKPWGDGLVLAAGHAVERENGHRARRPGLEAMLDATPA